MKYFSSYFHLSSSRLHAALKSIRDYFFEQSSRRNESIMNLNQSKLANNLPPNHSKQTRINRLSSLMAFLLVTLGAGYFSWTKIQLYVAQQLVHNCVENHNCAKNIDNVELLVEAKNRLKLFNLATANLFGVNLDHAYLDSVNLYGANLAHANLDHAYLDSVNLYNANLAQANLDHAYLIKAKNFTPAQIKSACNWSTALYRGKFDADKLTWIVDEKANEQFIQQLKKS